MCQMVCWDTEGYFEIWPDRHFFEVNIFDFLVTPEAATDHQVQDICRHSDNKDYSQNLEQWSVTERYLQPTPSWLACENTIGKTGQPRAHQ